MPNSQDKTVGAEISGRAAPIIDYASATSRANETRRDFAAISSIIAAVFGVPALLLGLFTLYYAFVTGPRIEREQLTVYGLIVAFIGVIALTAAARWGREGFGKNSDKL